MDLSINSRQDWDPHAHLGLGVGQLVRGGQQRRIGRQFSPKGLDPLESCDSGRFLRARDGWRSAPTNAVATM